MALAAALFVVVTGGAAAYVGQYEPLRLDSGYGVTGEITYSLLGIDKTVDLDFGFDIALRGRGHGDC